MTNLSMVRKADCSNVIILFYLNHILELDNGKVIIEVSWKNQSQSSFSIFVLADLDDTEGVL